MDGITVDSTLLAAKPPTPEKAPRSFYRLLPFEFTRKEERRKRDEKTDRQRGRGAREETRLRSIEFFREGGREARYLPEIQIVAGIALIPVNCQLIPALKKFPPREENRPPKL